MFFFSGSSSSRELYGRGGAGAEAEGRGDQILQEVSEHQTRPSSPLQVCTTMCMLCKGNASTPNEGFPLACQEHVACATIIHNVMRVL